MIKNMNDVIEFVKDHKDEEISIGTYAEVLVWCRILNGHHCIDHDTEGIIGLELPDLYRYIWNHRKSFNSISNVGSNFVITSIK
jgi:hypothetical protein